MPKPDLYAVLGVDRAASADEIKQAYRKLALEHHPDVNPGDSDAEERFKEISAAKEVLLSPEKRKLYDEFGMDALAPGFDAGEARAYREWANRAKHSPGYASFDGASTEGLGIEDLLSQLFGAQAADGPGDPFGNAHRAGFASGSDPIRGVDAETELEVDFVDAIAGNEIQMRIAGREPLRVTIPRGARDGARIRLKGQGVKAKTTGQDGDLYIRLKVRSHAVFRREGDDLHADLPVTLPELMLGADVEIPTSDGIITVKIPPHSSNGQTLRLPGHGVAKLASRQSGIVTKEDRGHLFLHLHAVLPTESKAELDELANQLKKFYDDKDPRSGIHWESRR